MSFIWRSRTALFRAGRNLIPRGTRGVTRAFDHLPLPLPYNIKDGLGKFLPPPALEAVAMEYQLGLLGRLTDEVAGTDDEDSSVTQVVTSMAPHREKTLAFNYASLALNNSFFLGQLTPDPNDAAEINISPALLTVIAANHGGIEQLKSSISAAAMGMFTSGYIWFVSDKNGNTSILPTFGPGTLLVRSRQLVAKGHGALYTELKIDPLAWDRDMEYVDKYMAEWLDDLSDSEGEEDSIGEEENQEKASNAKNGQRSLPSKSASGPIPRFLHTTANRAAGFESPAVPNVLITQIDALNSGDVLYPLFCISVHEHAWLYAGFGIWGKEAWLREFWTVLNWKQVSSAYADITAPSQ
ncbi:hypothetical protein C8J57DRAFT_1292533 [Mycena rebaudengoi]|nr:hypothetical protein C8J57DRAFT_1292533 [Mycena rebaudengoi]